VHAVRAHVAIIVLGVVIAGTAHADTKRCIGAAEQGQQQRRDGKLLAARSSFVACTASECPAVVRRDCAKWIDELDATIPTIVVRLEDEEGHDAVDGRVLLDGETLSGATSGRAFSVDPGSHRIAWMRPGGDLDEEIIVREGERNRVVVLRPKVAEKIPPPPPPLPPPAKTKSSIPWLVGGAGLVVGGTGALLWGLGLNDRSNLQSTCASAHTCADSDVRASRTKLIVGDVLVGVGVVAIAAAVYLLVTSGDDAGRSGVQQQFRAGGPLGSGSRP
jgi:hypothetical protein